MLEKFKNDYRNLKNRFFPTMKKDMNDKQKITMANLNILVSKNANNQFSSEDQSSIRTYEAPPVPFEADSITKATYVARQFSDAVISQGNVYMEEPTAFNRGWLNSFEEASDRATQVLQNVQAGTFEIQTEGSVVDYLVDILNTELALQNNSSNLIDSDSFEYHEGKIMAFSNYLVDDMGITPEDEYRLEAAARKFPNCHLEVFKNDRYLMCRTTLRTIRDDEGNAVSVELKNARNTSNTVNIKI